MKNIIILLLFAILPIISFAQPGGDEDVLDVPLDGGISLLLVAGVGYGAKKLYSLREKKQ